MRRSKANYNFSPVLIHSVDESRSAPLKRWDILLGRETAVQGSILVPEVAGKCILVTGAGGFIGSRMVRVLADSGAERIVLLDVAEQALFRISCEIASSGLGDRITPALGSVCDSSLLRALFDEYQPDLVIHAAALKHVPLMEWNPFAAVATNSIGTWRVAHIAADRRARMILISTDKAVAPHSIMGASKRIAELVMLHHPGFAALRLVNVIGSPGSVAPIFAQQIVRGGPVTVTHPAALRFFLTLDQVISLLAEAISAESEAGILAPDPGPPIFIAELARHMIVASGSDVPILFTEPRPGEKLEESLLSPDEQYNGDVTPSLRRILSHAALNLECTIAALEAAIAERDLPQLLSLAKDLVPDYEPSALLLESSLQPSSATA